MSSRRRSGSRASSSERRSSRARSSGTRVWLKCECLQTGGAFKLRGATNRLLQLSAEERERGVVAFSSGNHARGVAIAARRLGMRATIVMPSDAPRVKVDGTRGEGAEIVFYDRRTESREAIAARISEETGATVVPSFDDPAIVAGQGTAGLEIVEQLGRAAARASSFRAAAAGSRRGLRLPCPDADIVIVEPEGWDDMARSLELGEIVPVAADAPDTLLRCAPDSAACRRSPSASCASAKPRRSSVSDDEAAERGALRLERHELVVEPGGAVGAGGAARRQGRAAWTIRWWCCRAGMSIRRFTRGSSAAA